MKRNAPNLTRVFFLALFFFSAATQAGESSHPLVGAIRWDAWVGADSEVGRAVETSLSPPRWHERLPFFGKEISADKIDIRGNTQAVMDREIVYAKAAGLDYWAFCLYAPEDAMTRGGLDLYLASEHKNDVRFCGILQGGVVASWAKDWERHCERLVHYFLEASYQTVCDGRPLLFVLEPIKMIAPNGFADAGAAREAIALLRKKAEAAGCKAPYFVAMEWSPEAAKNSVDEFDLDAVSAYASNGGESAAPYSRLVATTQKNWDWFAQKNPQILPWVSTGWDRRPRVEHPVFWETLRLGRPVLRKSKAAGNCGTSSRSAAVDQKQSAALRVARGNHLRVE